MVDDGRGGVWLEGKVSLFKPAPAALCGSFGFLLSREQDKTRKVLEIWTKSGTFPPACLERLAINIDSPSYEPPPPVMSPALPPMEPSRTALGGYASGHDQGEWPHRLLDLVSLFCSLGCSGLSRSESRFAAVAQQLTAVRRGLLSAWSPFRSRGQLSNRAQWAVCLRTDVPGISDISTSSSGACRSLSATCMHPMRHALQPISILSPCSALRPASSERQ